MSRAARSGKLPGSGIWVWSSTQLQGFLFSCLNNLNIYLSAALHYFFIIILISIYSSSKCPCPWIYIYWNELILKSFPPQTTLGLMGSSGTECGLSWCRQQPLGWWEIVPLKHLLKSFSGTSTGWCCAAPKGFCAIWLQPTPKGQGRNPPGVISHPQGDVDLQALAALWFLDLCSKVEEISIWGWTFRCLSWKRIPGWFGVKIPQIPPSPNHSLFHFQCIPFPYFASRSHPSLFILKEFLALLQREQSLE